MPETKINDNKNRESLNNILLDDNTKDKKVSVLKIVLVGIIAFTIFISTVFAVKYFGNSDDKMDNVKINQDDIKNKLNAQLKKSKDNNLFEDVDIKQNDKVSDKFRNIINNIKNDKTVEKENKKEEQKETIEINKKIMINAKQEKSKVLVAPQKNSLIEKKQSNFIKKGFYIQVGAFYKLQPSDELLDKVKNNGFRYSLFKAKINNSFITKVVIGPYETKKDAIRNLSKVKKIESDAYILTLP